LALGLAALWVWGLCIFYMAFNPFQATPQFLSANPGLSPYPCAAFLPWLAATIGFVVCAFCMASFDKRITYHIRHYRLQIGMYTAFFCLTLLLLLAFYLAWWPLAVLCALLGGATAAFCTLLWGEAYRRRETLQIVVNAMLSLVLATMLFCLLLGLKIEWLFYLVICLMPLVQGFLLYVCLHGLKALHQKQLFFDGPEGERIPSAGVLEIPTFNRLAINRTKLLFRIMVPFAAMGLGFGYLIWQLFCTFNASSVLSLDRSLECFVAAAFACLIIILMVLVPLITHLDEDYSNFYRFLMPLLVCLLILAILISSELPLTAMIYAVVLFSSYLCMELLMWVKLINLSAAYRISPILLLGYGRSALMLGAAVTICFCTFFGTRISTWADLGYAILNLAVLLVFYLLLPRDKQIRDMVLKVAPPIPDAPEPAPKAAATSVKTSPKALSLSMPEPEPEPDKHRFAKRVEAVANTYLLSSRETEVLFLLAKGYSAKRMAETLFISQGTLNTHTWRIYKKLGLHSQQKVIDLVDAQKEA
jgi:DNA-binding CsgD family transcriptional regulator